MKPVEIVVRRTLEATPERVWALLTDWERQGEWMLEASDFVVTSDHREGVGVVAEATVRIGGISTRDEVRVDIWEPPVHLGIEHLGWVSGRGDLVLRALDGGRTALEWTESLRPPLGPLGAVGIRLFVPLMRRIFERDADVLADLVKLPGEEPRDR